jgi:hypothetical protein
MLVSLASAPLLAGSALAQEGDAVDSAVDSLTTAIKVSQLLQLNEQRHDLTDRLCTAAAQVRRRAALRLILSFLT